MRIGIFGGTFDPIHCGHLRIAETAREALGLDEVVFIPVGDPVHRDDAPAAGREDRYSMCVIATRGNPAFRVSRVETDNPEPAYTVHTLAAMRDEIADADVHLILGADEAIQFAAWKRPRDIVAVARLAIAPRAGLDEPAIRAASPDWMLEHTVFLPPLNIDISATGIRERARNGLSLRYVVPDGVRQYIEERRLYRAGADAQAVAQPPARSAGAH